MTTISMNLYQHEKNQAFSSFAFGDIVDLKITHMRRSWGTPQNFFFVFIDEFEKQIIIKKTVQVGQ